MPYIQFSHIDLKKDPRILGDLLNYSITNFFLLPGLLYVPLPALRPNSIHVRFLFDAMLGRPGLQSHVVVLDPSMQIPCLQYFAAHHSHASRLSDLNLLP